MKFLAILALILCICGCLWTAFTGFVVLALDNLSDYPADGSTWAFALALWGLVIVGAVGGFLIFKAPAKAATILLGVGLVLLFIGLWKSNFTVLGKASITVPFGLAGVLAWFYARALSAKMPWLSSVPKNYPFKSKLCFVFRYA